MMLLISPWARKVARQFSLYSKSSLVGVVYFAIFACVPVIVITHENTTSLTIKNSYSVLTQVHWLCCNEKNIQKESEQNEKEEPADKEDAEKEKEK